MAKNKIQFQKGLSLTEFLSQYGTEEQCREALFRMPWPQGFQCPKCGHPGYCEIRDRKVYQCYKCHAQTSLIQGTIFAGTKLPLRLISDGLHCFPAVTRNQCQHEPIVISTGGKYDDRKVFQWLNTVIGNVKNALHGTHHAISGRHLPRYPAEFCYLFNRRFQLHTMVDRLAYVALRTQPVPQRLLKLAEVRW